MRSHFLLAFGLLLAFSHSSFADNHIQTFEQDWALPEPPSEAEFAPFDTYDGARVLTGVQLTYQGDLWMEYVVENFTPQVLEPNEWFVETSHLVLAAFDATEDFPDGGPFAFMGGIGARQITGGLGAGSGGPFGGVAGDPVVEGRVEGSINSRNEIDATFFDYFLVDESIRFKTSPFTEFLFTAPSADAFIDARATDQSQVGTLSLRYEYDLVCDFNDDRACDVADIDLLIREIATGGTSLDITADGLVDLDDRDQWLKTSARVNGFSEPYMLGDANLNGIVESRDLNRVGVHWQTRTSRWSHGDFDGSGVVDTEDLNLIGVNWRQQIAQPASVPEPSSGWMLGLLGVFLLRRTRVEWFASA